MLLTALQGGPNHSHQGGYAQSKVHKDARGTQMVSLLYLHICHRLKCGGFLVAVSYSDWRLLCCRGIWWAIIVGM